MSLFGKSDSRFCPLGSKKQRAIADREQDLLNLAETIMERDGFSGLTMDKVVAASNYSKGTVYNHFNSKEDLLCALCIKSMKRLISLFRRAQHFEGTTRERMLATQFAYRLHALSKPTLFMSILTSHTPAVAEKASAERLKEDKELDHEITMLCAQLLEEATTNGDLTLRPGLDIQSLTFANWAVSFGTLSLMTATGDVEITEHLNSEQALILNTGLMMDGMNWQPLFSDWDYQSTWQRIGQEVFPAELAALQGGK